MSPEPTREARRAAQLRRRAERAAPPTPAPPVERTGRTRPRKVIAYVGNFTQPFCTERHVEQALAELGYRVLRLQESRLDFRTVPRAVARSRASMLLWTRTWDVNHRAAFAALAELRSMHIPTASFHLDRWWGLDREYQITSEPFFRTDMVFTADGGREDDWKAAGIEHRWLPPAVSGPDCAPTRPDPAAWPHEVVFVGSHPYPHKEWAPYRTQVIDTARAVAGDRFAVLPGLTSSGARNPAIREGRLRQLYATAKIVVGDSCLAGGVTHYVSDRIPETLGRGGFLIHPRVEGVTDGGVWTEGEHLACYDLGDFDELARLVAYYLDPARDDERRRIAAAGREFTLAHHTYKHRMDVVLREVGLPCP